MEVNNGGFHQYFSNSSGDDWDIILWGIQESNDEVGASKVQGGSDRISQRAGLTRDRVHRGRQLDSLGERQWKAFDSFDKEFYEKPFPDFEKSWALILSRIREFQPAWPERRPAEMRGACGQQPDYSCCGFRNGKMLGG